MSAKLIVALDTDDVKVAEQTTSSFTLQSKPISSSWPLSRLVNKVIPKILVWAPIRLRAATAAANISLPPRVCTLRKSG
ncbi:hypothetical protein ACFL2I_07220, partial [Candidatus Omnitrophota bacterium]